VVDASPFASGRAADVFALGDGRVLRRYRNGGDVAVETQVMMHAATQGFPVPIIYDAHGTDLVMERLEGPTMLSAISTGEIGIEEAAVVLADLHRRLHELPAPWNRDPAVRLLHMDLHPDNVILAPGGPVVIDWSNAREGPADLDIAMSAVIMAQVAVDRTETRAALATAMLVEYLHSVGGNPMAALDQVVAIRRANPTLTSQEINDLPAAAAVIARHA
jgi:aminoglycoside phosphotransferase (APT) family kinase protein